MRIDILSAVPELLQSPFSHSILQRGQDAGIVSIHIHNIRDFSSSKHRQIDDYQYGGGAGMVMKIEPIMNCVEYICEQSTPDEIIYMTPDGDVLNQKMANTLSLQSHLIIICGHYKGIDDRLRQHVITKEISIGSYVLSGGELPAAVLVDSICRLIPGVIGDETSALMDSFQDNLLAPPVYTRPENYNGWKVPKILLSGNQKKIDEWRDEQAISRTKERRPDLLEGQD